MALRIYLSFVLFLSFYSLNAFPPIESHRSRVPALGFSWGNCGPGSDPLQFKNLQVSPDPIRMPGNITVNMTVSLAIPLPKNIHVSVNMEKKIAGIWFKVPCKNNIGSCNYGNICANLTNFHPKYFTKYDAPTKCPIPAGTFSIENLVVYEAKSIPSEANGEFQVTADISDASGHLACIHLDFSLKG